MTLVALMFVMREKGIPVWVLALAMICDTMMIVVLMILAAPSISRIWAA
jgi:hypothetical protein